MDAAVRAWGPSNSRRLQLQRWPMQIFADSLTCGRFATGPWQPSLWTMWSPRSTRGAPSPELDHRGAWANRIVSHQAWNYPAVHVGNWQFSGWNLETGWLSGCPWLDDLPTTSERAAKKGIFGRDGRLPEVCRQCRSPLGRGHRLVENGTMREWWGKWYPARAASTPPCPTAQPSPL